MKQRIRKIAVSTVIGFAIGAAAGGIVYAITKSKDAALLTAAITAPLASSATMEVIK